MWKQAIIKDWTKFWNIIIIKEATPVIRHRRFECECICWKTIIVYLSNIRKNPNRSCGCRNKGNTTHWLSKTRFWNTYRGITQRCKDKSQDNYYLYWGRGIKCEWDTFEEFYEDMWGSYKKWLTIDRLDNNWNYCKLNCKWSTMKEQARNKRNTLKYKWRCVQYWIEELWITRGYFEYRRYRKKLSVKKSLWLR